MYDVLERLGSKGLVSHAMIGDIKHFSSVESYRLHDYILTKEQKLKAQKQLVSRIIPDLGEIAGKKRKNLWRRDICGRKRA
ncbi:MAG: hypothetical protein M3Y53_01420 [Thermoproteota archaeon]|nr:hypothetical protein [Thermoproteota archaeon]